MLWGALLPAALVMTFLSLAWEGCGSGYMFDDGMYLTFVLLAFASGFLMLAMLGACQWLFERELDRMRWEADAKRRKAIGDSLPF